MIATTPVQRGVCPYCGIDAGTGPYAHTTQEGCIKALKGARANYQRRISLMVLDQLEEVKNHIGGVTGYTLSLNADQTERLLRVIEGDKP